MAKNRYFFVLAFTRFFFAAAVFFLALVVPDFVFPAPNALSQFSQNFGVVPVRTIGPPIVLLSLYHHASRSDSGESTEQRWSAGR